LDDFLTTFGTDLGASYTIHGQPYHYYDLINQCSNKVQGQFLLFTVENRKDSYLPPKVGYFSTSSSCNQGLITTGIIADLARNCIDKSS
jgi:hypothetical protein